MSTATVAVFGTGTAIGSKDAFSLRGEVAVLEDPIVCATECSLLVPLCCLASAVSVALGKALGAGRSESVLLILTSSDGGPLDSTADIDSIALPGGDPTA
jgi:hypothetical protein